MAAPLLAVGASLLKTYAKQKVVEKGVATLASGNESSADSVKENAGGAPTENPLSNPRAYERTPQLKANVESTIGRIAGMPNQDLLEDNNDSLLKSRGLFVKGLAFNDPISKVMKDPTVNQNTGNFLSKISTVSQDVDTKLRAGAFNEPVPDEAIGSVRAQRGA